MSLFGLLSDKSKNIRVASFATVESRSVMEVIQMCPTKKVSGQEEEEIPPPVDGCECLRVSLGLWALPHGSGRQNGAIFYPLNVRQCPKFGPIRA